MNIPIIGAIRWDAWHDGEIGRQVEASLGPDKWRYRMPFFGIETSSVSVQLRADSQAVMDQEIIYAKNGGLNYWAFLTYETLATEGMSRSLSFYKSSSIRNQINYCLIFHAYHFGSRDKKTQINRYVNEFKQTSYQKVLGNRPLVYIYPMSALISWAGSESATKKFFLDLKKATQAAGLGAPYYVSMFESSIDQDAYYVGLFGLQALSAYACVGGYNYTERSYADLVSLNTLIWNAQKQTGTKVVPLVSSGWDPRPRWEIPVSWDLNPIWGDYYTTPTPIELANNLKNAIDWTTLNPTVADANTIIIYAWNEIDEGGWLLPSNPIFNNSSTSRLDAIANTINNLTPLKSIGHWVFNEQSGSIVYDVSDYKTNGSLIGSPIWEINSLKFDGINDKVNVSDASHLKGMEQLTLVGWFKYSALPNANTVIFGKEGSYRFILNSNSGGHFVLSTNNNSWYSSGTIVGFPFTQANIWYHIAAVYNGQRILIYLNGQLVDQTTQNISGPVSNTTEPLTFGAINASNIEYFNGSIKDVSIYNIALSSNQIQSLSLDA